MDVMVPVLEKFLRWLFPGRDRRTARRVTGDLGEREAERFFKRAGYRVLARNWRSGRDEIDLVLLSPDGAMPVFVEVKTRAEHDPRGGYFAVGTQKKKALRRAVRAYLKAARAASGPWRFDIAEVRREASGTLRVIHHCAVRLFPK